LFRQAAQQDYIHSMYNLGIILFARGNSQSAGSSSISSSNAKKKKTMKSKSGSTSQKRQETTTKKKKKEKEEEEEVPTQQDDHHDGLMNKVGELWKWLNGKLESKNRDSEIHEALEWLKRAAEKGSQHAKDKLKEHKRTLMKDNKLMKSHYFNEDYDEEEHDDEGYDSDIFGEL
jgi:TPR repeat protein